MRRRTEMMRCLMVPSHAGYSASAAGGSGKRLKGTCELEFVDLGFLQGRQVSRPGQLAGASQNFGQIACLFESARWP